MRLSVEAPFASLASHSARRRRGSEAEDARRQRMTASRHAIRRSRVRRETLSTPERRNSQRGPTRVSRASASGFASSAAAGSERERAAPPPAQSPLALLRRRDGCCLPSPLASRHCFLLPRPPSAGVTFSPRRMPALSEMCACVRAQPRLGIDGCCWRSVCGKGPPSRHAPPRNGALLHAAAARSVVERARRWPSKKLFSAKAESRTAPRGGYGARPTAHSSPVRARLCPPPGRSRTPV